MDRVEQVGSCLAQSDAGSSAEFPFCVFKKVPEAQFVMQIISLISLRAPSSCLKSLGAKGCVAIHDHGFVDLSGSVLLSGLQE